jgi:N6-adenosine-specific RNA methylase IME4
MAGKPRGRRALTPTEHQRRWRAKKKRLATGAEKRERREARLDIMRERTDQAMARLPDMQLFNVIMADPPPPFETYSNITGMDRAVENHYETMTLEAIKALRIPAAPDCRLYLWSTVPLLPKMLQVMEAWGFRYSSHIVWVKGTLDGTKVKHGTGYETFNAHELLLIGDKGDVPSPIPGQQPLSVIFAPRTEHSSKPAVFIEMVERLFPDMRRLEMFGRQERPGWTVWGNEVLSEAA